MAEPKWLSENGLAKMAIVKKAEEVRCKKRFLISFQIGQVKMTEPKWLSENGGKGGVKIGK